MVCNYARAVSAYLGHYGKTLPKSYRLKAADRISRLINVMDYIFGAQWNKGLHIAGEVGNIFVGKEMAHDILRSFSPSFDDTRVTMFSCMM